jgi:hypothetical protein
VQIGSEGGTRAEEEEEEELSGGRVYKDWDGAGSMCSGTPTTIGSVVVMVVLVIVLVVVLVVLLVGVVVAECEFQIIGVDADEFEKSSGLRSQKM